MTKRLANEIIVGLDIGTSKVLAVVAEVKENQDIEILGVGQHPSRGLRKGVVANIDSTVQSIQQAIEEAELTAECRINSVYAGIAGAHITSMNSSGVVAIKNRRNDRLAHYVITAKRPLRSAYTHFSTGPGARSWELGLRPAPAPPPSPPARGPWGIAGS